ncbi:Zn(II)2Cys6 transcription factor [Aspergillus ambiguus]|uniref:Zn(II)2Cys6 transcription factor n=1 Tax=Aspergillus ambiguus TaxID=176160 RepID=UPI003CCD3623
MQTARRSQKRTPNACIACRQSKVKCSGSKPCTRCQRRSVQCEFSGATSKVVVSERYLRRLQTHIKQLQRLTGVSHTRNGPVEIESNINDRPGSDGVCVHSETARSQPKDSHASQTNGYSCSIWTSPFTLPTTVLSDTRRPNKRNWIWLAPSSACPLEMHLDGDIYPLDWTRDPTSGCSAELPSLDYALHMLNITKLHLGQAYRFLDEDSFVSHILAFYNNSEEETAESRIWFVQFLLILAFGKAFLSRPNGHDAPGSKFFVRAMSIMPVDTSTGRDSLMVIEALALAALYLYAIDHRENAHLYVGQAVRIAQLEGLHTRLPEEDLGPKIVARCESIWWTLYILDHQVSFSLGLPTITQDCVISTLISAPCESPQAVVFNLQVKLSQMLSSIVATIYKTEKTQLGTFLESTRNILQTMAGFAEEMEAVIPGKFQKMDTETVSQETRHIVLLYHQCVIIATRPLLLSVLKERLDKLGHAEEDWQGFLALPRSLISTGIKSAVTILNILSDENIFLEVFLPFDLEFTYAAAIHLTMGNALFQPDAVAQSYSEQGHKILDEMISRGNKIARVRKNELKHLERLFHELNERVREEGLQILTLSDEREEQGLAPEADLSHNDMEILPSVDPEAPTDLDALDSIGISSNEFLSIIDQIGNAEIASGLDPVSGWLRDGNIASLYDEIAAPFMGS